jgi:hypothetical protein
MHGMPLLKKKSNQLAKLRCESRPRPPTFLTVLTADGKKQGVHSILREKYLSMGDTRIS